MDKVSVIVPVYNASMYLNNCVKSLLGQTYSNIEVILVDDGSSDGSSQLCDKLSAEDLRVRVIHQKNSGVSAARNTGLKAATGAYIGFADSDDMLKADMYEAMMQTARQYDADIIATGVIIRNLSGEEQLEYPAPTAVYEMNPNLAIERILTKKLNVAVYTKLFKRDIINELRFRNDKRFEEDKFFIFEALLHAQKIIEIPECKYIYMKREGSATTSLVSKKNFDAYDLAIEIQQCIMAKHQNLAFAAQYNLIYTIILLMRRLEDEGMTRTYASERAKCLSTLRENQMDSMKRYGSTKEIVEFILLKYNASLYGLYRKLLKQYKRIKNH